MATVGTDGLQQANSVPMPPLGHVLALIEIRIHVHCHSLAFLHRTRRTCLASDTTATKSARTKQLLQAQSTYGISACESRALTPIRCSRQVHERSEKVQAAALARTTNQQHRLPRRCRIKAAIRSCVRDYMRPSQACFPKGRSEMLQPGCSNCIPCACSTCRCQLACMAVGAHQWQTHACAHVSRFSGCYYLF